MHLVTGSHELPEILKYLSLRWPISLLVDNSTKGLAETLREEQDKEEWNPESGVNMQRYTLSVPTQNQPTEFLLPLGSRPLWIAQAGVSFLL